MDLLLKQDKGRYGIVSFLTILVIISAFMYMVVHLTREVVTFEETISCIFVGLLFAVCWTCTRFSVANHKELTEGVTINY
jgi:hypothetical protein